MPNKIPQFLLSLQALNENYKLQQYEKIIITFHSDSCLFYNYVRTAAFTGGAAAERQYGHLRQVSG